MMKLTDRILGLLFPPKCVLCGALLTKEELDLCHTCRIHGPGCASGSRKLSFITDWAAVWHYEGNVRRSLIRYKFYGARSYVHAYGRLLAMKLQREFPEGFDLITWVPISRLRKLRRGFDQVELLADAVGRELGIAPLPLLRKVRHNKPQSGIIGDAHRRANVLGAYTASDPELLRGKRILLLDDIITTGATVGECARVLLTAGGKEVYAAAVAAARHSRKSK